MKMGEEQNKTASEPLTGPEPTSAFVQAAEELLNAPFVRDTVNPRLQEDLEDLLIASSLGIDPAAAALHRHVPVEIYIPGNPNEIDQLFLDLLMGTIEFAAHIGWSIHNSGPVQHSSLKAGFVLRTTEKVNLEELQEDTEIIGEIIEEGLRARNETVKARREAVELREKEAKIQALTEQAKLSRAKRFATYALFIGSLATSLIAVPPGSYIQIGTTRVERSADSTFSVEQVPPSKAAAVVYFAPKASGDPEKQETK